MVVRHLSLSPLFPFFRLPLRLNLLRFFSPSSSRSTTSLPIEHRRYDYCPPTVFLISSATIAFHTAMPAYCIDQYYKIVVASFEKTITRIGRSSLDKVGGYGLFWNNFIALLRVYDIYLI